VPAAAAAAAAAANLSEIFCPAPSQHNGLTASASVLHCCLAPSASLHFCSLCMLAIPGADGDLNSELVGDGELHSEPRQHSDRNCYRLCDGYGQ